VCAAQPDNLHLERPLLTAVKDGSCQLARLLLAHGASLHAPTERGCTPLSVAVAFEQVEAARLLLGLGADVHQVRACLPAFFWLAAVEDRAVN
jgi:ankyrin repeat protein